MYFYITYYSLKSHFNLWLLDQELFVPSLSFLALLFPDLSVSDLSFPHMSIIVSIGTKCFIIIPRFIFFKFIVSKNCRFKICQFHVLHISDTISSEQCQFKLTKVQLFINPNKLLIKKAFIDFPCVCFKYYIFITKFNSNMI